MKVNVNKYCLSCGCELEKGEVGTCSECATAKNQIKNIKQMSNEVTYVPFPKIQFQF